MPGGSTLSCSQAWWMKDPLFSAGEHFPGCFYHWLFDRCHWIEWAPGAGLCMPVLLLDHSASLSRLACRCPHPWTGQLQELESYSLEPGVHARSRLAQRSDSAHCQLSKALWSGDHCGPYKAVSIPLLCWRICCFQSPEKSGASKWGLGEPAASTVKFHRGQGGGRTFLWIYRRGGA